MKTLLSFFIAITFLTITPGFKNATSNTFNDDKTEVFFSNKLQFDDLVKLKLDLAEKKIVVNYELLEFDKTNKLKAIAFSVISEDKFCGSGKILDLSKYEYGFRVDKSPKADVYFSVGITKGYK